MFSSPCSSRASAAPDRGPSLGMQPCPRPALSPRATVQRLAEPQGESRAQAGQRHRGASWLVSLRMCHVQGFRCTCSSSARAGPEPQANVSGLPAHPLALSKAPPPHQPLEPRSFGDHNPGVGSGAHGPGRRTPVKCLPGLFARLSQPSSLGGCAPRSLGYCWLGAGGVCSAVLSTDPCLPAPALWAGHWATGMCCPFERGQW